ncbi:MAG: hypothetical protein ACREAN_05525, partial [Nitrosopumilaceae archaeon]
MPIHNPAQPGDTITYLTFAALRAAGPPQPGVLTANVLNRAVEMDGGGGIFQWHNEAQITAFGGDDDGFILKPIGAPVDGYWIRLPPDSGANIAWYGAYPNGVIDSGPAFTKCDNLIQNTPFNFGPPQLQLEYIYIPGRPAASQTYQIKTAVTIQSSVRGLPTQNAGIQISAQSTFSGPLEYLNLLGNPNMLVLSASNMLVNANIFTSYRNCTFNFGILPIANSNNGIEFYQCNFAPSCVIQNAAGFTFGDFLILNE